MGNKPGKTETYRSKSLSRIFQNHSKELPSFGAPLQKKTSDLRTQTQGIPRKRQSNGNLGVAIERSLSPSFDPQSDFSTLNARKAQRFRDKDQIEEIEKAAQFASEYLQLFSLAHLNAPCNTETLFFEARKYETINPSLNLLSRKFSKRECRSKEIDSFLEHLTQQEFQIHLERCQNKKGGLKPKEKEYSPKCKDLFPFLIKKKSKSRSASSNEREYKPNSFRILNGHVFSFQTELQKQREENPVQPQVQMQEVPEEESSLQDSNAFEELDAISQQKLAKMYIKKEKSQKTQSIFDTTKYRELCEREKQLLEPQAPPRVEIDLAKIKNTTKKIELEKPRLIDQLFHNSTENSLKEIKPKLPNRPKLKSTKKSTKPYLPSKYSKKRIPPQPPFPSQQQNFKKQAFDPERYLKGEQQIQALPVRAQTKPSQKPSIISRFRESAKKRSLKSLQREDSIAFEQESIESELYRDILEDFKTGPRPAPPNKVHIDISKLSRKFNQISQES